MVTVNAAAGNVPAGIVKEAGSWLGSVETFKTWFKAMGSTFNCRPSTQKNRRRRTPWGCAP